MNARSFARRGRAGLGRRVVTGIATVVLVAVAEAAVVRLAAPAADATPAPLPTYSITDLGTFGGGQSEAEAVNNSDDVVGWAEALPPSGASTPVDYAFFYHNGSLINLGTLGATKPGSVGSVLLSDARAINDTGTITGSAQTPTNDFHAFRNAPGTSLTDISGGASYSFGQGLNSVGVAAGVAGNAPQYPAVWNASGPPLDLYEHGCVIRSDHQGDGAAFAINDAGAVVGQEPLGGTLGQEGHHAFLCRPAATSTDPAHYALTDLGPPTATDSAAYAINSDGVSAGKSDHTGVMQAVTWDVNGNVTDLGTAPAGYTPPDGSQSIAYGINDSGDAVGTFHYQGAVNHAFLVHGGQMVDLNSLLPSNSGWLLTEARGINASGDIVGQGIINKQPHAFLMTTKVPQLNITATGIEVNQVIQDEANSVPLFTGKRTIAVVHAHTNGRAAQGVTATLHGTLNGVDMAIPLKPINGPSGRINLVQFPQRSDPNDSFIFELPPAWVQSGTLHLHADVNPDQHVAENDTTDDGVDATVQLHDPPKVNLKLFNLLYPTSSGFVKASAADLATIRSELRRMYPADLSITDTTSLSPFDPGALNTHGSLAGTIALNAAVSLTKLQSPLAWGDLWYVAVTDKGGFMRGASRFGSLVGAGPAGPPCGGPNPSYACSWDGDASYGDWMATHETAHALGRHHIDDCNTAEPFDPYPNNTGSIGGPTSNPDQFVGVDMGDAALGVPSQLKDSSWTDNMTYCPRQWISATTYEALADELTNLAGGHVPQTGGTGSGAPATDALTVQGTVDLAAQTAQLTDVARLSDSTPTTAAETGPYHLLLVSAAGSVLADHPFTPQPIADGAGDNGQTAPIGSIDETVPFVAGTTKLVIHSDLAGKDIVQRLVSAHAPTVSITAPTAGTTLPATGSVTVSWTASDADADPLSYDVLYSGDGGTNWQPLAAGVTGTSIDVDAATLPGTTSAGGRLRVIADDGVNTGSADSASFTVPGKAPSMSIEAPSANSVWSTGQTVVLAGSGDDLQDGSLGNAQLTWTSDRDGVLGSGRLLGAQSLSVGTHVITLTGTNSLGQQAKATTTITVVGDAAQPGPTLAAWPTSLAVGSNGAPTQHANVDLRNTGSGDVSWTATSDDSRVSLDASAGAAPAELGLTIDTSALAAGQSFTAHVTVTPDNGAGPITIPVLVDSTASAVTVPTSLDFGTQQVLRASPAQSVTVGYSGAGSLTLDAATVTGAAADDFAITSDGCSGTTIATGNSCVLKVQVTPSAGGDRDAYLVLADHNSSDRWYVHLTATGAGQVTHTVVGWGLNSYGEVGVSPSGTCTCEPTPVQVPGLSDVTGIASSDRHSVAVRADGTVWTWGSDLDSQLGDGTPADGDPHPTPTQVAGITDAVSVVATQRMSLALRANGTVLQWGDAASVISQPTAVLDAVTKTPLSDVVAIAGGSNGSGFEEDTYFALKSDGTVWSWGFNTGGELGNGSTASLSTNAVQVSNLTGVTAISYLMALKSDGSVWTWGDNYLGQLGAYNYPTISRYTTARTPVRATEQNGPLTDVVKIASFGNERFALKSDGTVWGWGAGQTRGEAQRDVGTGNSNSAELVAWATPVVGPTGTGQLSDVTDIGPGIALRSDGSVWAWGDASFGGLGNGALTQTYAPVEVSGVGGIGNLDSEITGVVGGDHKFAIRRSVANGSQKSAQTITFAGPTGPATYGGAPIALSASASSGLPVSFTVDGPCSVSDSTLTLLGAGNCTITAHQAGDTSTDAATDVQRTLTINRALLSVSGPTATRAYGLPDPALVPSYTGFVGTDTATNQSITVTCSSSASASSAPGAYTVTCTGPVSTTNYTLNYVSGTLTVTKAPTSTAITSLSPNPATVNGSVTIAVSVIWDGAGAAPTGSVTFADAGTSIGSARLVSGTATFTASIGGGTHRITATYSGDGNYLRSSSTATALSVPCTTYITGVHGAITATSGTVCIVNATITGGISVGAGVTLDIEASTVQGSVTSRAAAAVRMCRSRMQSATVSSSTGPVVIGSGAPNCAGNSISGGLTVSANTGGTTVVGNTVGGSLLITGNSAPVVVRRNGP